MQTVRGFTLIELLVVISITALVGIVAFANFKNFTQDQILRKAEGQIQTYLRLAQANATSSFVCGTTGGVSWSVIFRSDGVNIDLACGLNDMVKQTLSLKDAEIIAASGSSCQASFPLTFRYAALSGKLTSTDQCINNSSTININLKNLKNNSQKSFNISKGGAIDVE